MSEERKVCWKEGPLADLWRRASAGDANAACRLGDAYREGRLGLRHSPAQMYFWYARSALAGDAYGRNNLGACFERGIGCTPSYVRAVKWYRLAAAQGMGTASMNLAYCYLRGKGVPADRAEAVRLLGRAVEQGEPRARDLLAKLGVEAPKSQVRFVAVTEPGRSIGFVGLGLPVPALGQVPELADPVVSEGAVKAVLKDDCFELPEPGSAAAQEAQREWEKMKAIARAKGLMSWEVD